MEELIIKLKEQIIDALNLEEMTPEDIENDAPSLARAWVWIQSTLWS